MKMDQETKDLVSKIQQSIWKLEQSRELLAQVPGMGDYESQLEQAIIDLEQEMDELWSLD